MLVWKTISNFLDYEVSDTGKIRNKTTGKELRPGNCRGYLIVVLCKCGAHKTKPVHRIVAEAFLPNPENKPEINYKDGNPCNNDVSNLEWTTRSENICHRRDILGYRHSDETKAKLSNSQQKRRVECVETGSIYESPIDAQRKTGVYESAICACLHRRLKTAGGHHWREVK